MSARRLFCRRAVSAVLVLVYAITVAGVPLPTGIKTKKTDELYPCATSGCGCDSAERCWRSCCCHSLAERLAWAEEHGVRPPAFAIAEARRAGFTLNWLAENPCSSDVCAKSCCDSAAAVATRSCCEHAVAAASQKPVRSCCQSHQPETQSTPTTGHIVGWQALKCRGQTMNWCVAVPTLIGAQLQLSDELPLIDWLGPVASEVSFFMASDPAVPPPKWA